MKRRPLTPLPSGPALVRGVLCLTVGAALAGCGHPPTPPPPMPPMPPPMPPPVELRELPTAPPSVEALSVDAGRADAGAADAGVTAPPTPVKAPMPAPKPPPR